MIKKKTLKTSSEAKRDEIAEETETFLSAGHEINHIPYGVSDLDPMGRGKPITHGQQKNRTMAFCLWRGPVKNSYAGFCSDRPSRLT